LPVKYNSILLLSTTINIKAERIIAAYRYKMPVCELGRVV